MQKVYRCLSLLLTFVLIGGMLLTPSVGQAAPMVQESGDDSVGKAYLPMIAVPAQSADTIVPLTPDQYDSESAEAPALPEGQVQGATCFTYVKFTNSSSQTINVYWVNSYGNEVLYKTLSSGYSYWQQTYYGHSWRVRNSSGALLKSFTVNTCSYVYITIYNSDFPQPTATPTPALGSIGDRVWNDLNRNGLQDSGESGISGVRVELWVDSDNNGSHDTLVTTTTTNSSGNYSFTSLNTSKRYVVKFFLPTCFVFTTPNVGSNDAIDSDVTVFSYGGTDLISLATNRNTVDVDAGMYNNCTPTATATPTNTPVPQLGSIGDFVWNDLNRNGVQDGGEPGVVNVIMQLKDCAGNLIRTTTTNSSGAYSFTGLSAGCYTIGIVVPGGFQISPKAQGTNNNLDSDINIGNAMSDAINLGAGQNITNIDAGINQPVAPTATPTPTNTPAPQLGSLGDRVWNDVNRNGIQEAGEPGVVNVTVELKDCGGNLLRTTTTNASGIYSFGNLAAGCYLVNVVLPGGFQFSPQDQGGNDTLDSDVNPANGTTTAINLGAGQNIDTVDVGINQPVAPTATPTPTNTPAPQLGSLGDRVWNDVNRNGIQEAGEPGVVNVTVELKDCGGNLLRTTTTNASGIYSFGNLAAGCYLVNVVLPGGFQFSPQDQGGNDTLDSDVNPANGTTTAINLGAGQNIDTVDAGINQPVAPTATPTNTPAPQLGSIGDTVFRDNNGNGVQDGEPGVANVTVQLKDCSGNVLQTTTTNSNGNYSFGNLSAGCYSVTVLLPGGFAYSPQDQGGNDNTDSDVNPGNGTTGNINLGAGQNLTNVDAGLVPQGGGTACIGDRTWRDTNANGIQDPGEPNLDGIEIYLGTDSNNDGRIDRYFGNTISANGGQYQFCGLDPAITYAVEFVPPGFCGITLPNVGNDDTIDSDPDLNKGIANGIVVVSGVSNNTIDAGFVCHD